jgi:hypothetical protein
MARIMMVNKVRLGKNTVQGNKPEIKLRVAILFKKLEFSLATGNGHEVLEMS